MRKSQVNRSVVAARAASRPARDTSTAPVSRNLGARPSTRVTPSGYVKRSRAVPLTATQRNSEGKRSEWSASPQFFTDPKWSRTVRECE